MIDRFFVIPGGVSMGKNARLADIYIKIYNKKPLTLDDMKFLSVYDPECFEKTCKNLIFNLPETKTLMQSRQDKISEEVPKIEKTAKLPEPKTEILSGEDKIKILLENLKKMERDESGVQNVSAQQVKNLLGSLYMEMLFPHNDRDRYFRFENDDSSTFNKKV